MSIKPTPSRSILMSRFLPGHSARQAYAVRRVTEAPVPAARGERLERVEQLDQAPFVILNRWEHEHDDVLGAARGDEDLVHEGKCPDGRDLEAILALHQCRGKVAAGHESDEGRESELNARSQAHAPVGGRIERVEGIGHEVARRLPLVDRRERRDAGDIHPNGTHDDRCDLPLVPDGYGMGLGEGEVPLGVRIEVGGLDDFDFPGGVAQNLTPHGDPSTGVRHLRWPVRAIVTWALAPRRLAPTERSTA